MIKIHVDTNVRLSSDPSRRVEVRVAVCTVSPTTNPCGGSMDAQSFFAALTPAVTDAEARERFLADPKAVLATAGLDLPEWVTVSAREGDAAELTITLPALRDPHADLSDEGLEGVVGGNPPSLFHSRSTLCL
jgi:hypothetical protein